MKKQLICGLALATALALPLVGCGDSASSSDAGNGSAATTQTTSDAGSDSDFDANAFYAGQWRGSVETTGQTVYGTAGGTEQMLDVIFNDDGTVEVVPLEAHADLLTDEGTWEGTADEVTLHLSAGDITLSVTGSATMEGTASDFDIADFDTILFDFYG